MRRLRVELNECVLDIRTRSREGEKREGEGIWNWKKKGRASVLSKWYPECDKEGALRYDKGIDRFRVPCLLVCD